MQENENLVPPSPHDLDGSAQRLTVLDALQVLAENIRLLVILPILVGVLAFVNALFTTPTFIANTKFLPPQQQQSSAAGLLASLGSIGGLAGAAAGLKNPVDQYVSFLKTRAIQDALVDRFDLQTRYDEKFRQDTRRVLEKRSVIAAGKDNIVSIDFEDEDPKAAADVANAYIEELRRLLDRLAVTEAQQRRVFFEKQVASSKDNLIRAEQTLATSGVSTSVLNATPTMALEGPARLRAQVTAQEVKLASMRSYLTSSAPEVRQAQAELDALRNQLQKSEKEQPAGGAPGSNDYIAKYREFKYQEALYEMFSKQYELARIDESREGAVVQVIDVAKPPEVKAKPKKAIIALTATIMTFFAVLAFVFVRNGMRRSAGDSLTSSKMRNVRAALRRSIGLGPR